MFYLNLDFILCWALVLSILSNFIFQSDIVFPEFCSPFMQFFSKIALHVFSELRMQSFCVIDLYRLHMKFVWTSNKVDIYACQKRRMNVLEKLFWLRENFS